MTERGTSRTKETIELLQTEVGLLKAKLAQQRQQMEQRMKQKRQQLEQRVEQQQQQRVEHQQQQIANLAARYKTL